MELVNTDKDYHIHTMNFSDGVNTVEEVVQYAGRKGLKGIAITDHSDDNMRAWKRPLASGRGALKRWRNVHNEVEVLFGVEADILNEAGDICPTISGIEGDILVLSAHKETYEDDPQSITQGYLNALRRFHGKIAILGHVDAVYFGEYVDVKAVVSEANKHGVIVEFNAKNHFDGRSVPQLTRTMLETADKVMVNSDAHCLADLDYRERALRYLEENGYLDNDNA